MKVKEGDTIGTKDGRYGTISFIVTQDHFLVNEAVDIDEPCPTEVNQFWTGIDNVASIV